MAVVRGHSPGTVYATDKGGTGQCLLPLRCCTSVHGGDAGKDVEGIPDDPTKLLEYFCYLEGNQSQDKC